MAEIVGPHDTEEYVLVPRRSLAALSNHAPDDQTALEAKISAAGGSDSPMVSVSVPMPPEMLAIIARWKAMGQMPVLFIKPSTAMTEIRVIALRMAPEIAARI